MQTIDFYISKGQLVKDDTIKSKAKSYLNKARHNLEILDALDKLNINKQAKEILKISQDFDSSEWVVISGYYAMYTASLALLAKVGFRSKNHTATLLVLEEYFVKKKLLDQTSYLKLKNASFQKEELEKISEARHQREIAQYSITKQTTKDIAQKIKKDTYEFINKVELILE